MFCFFAVQATIFAAPAAEVGKPCETNASPVLAHVRHEEGPGLLPADRVYVTAGMHKFAFLVPTGFKMEPWDDGRVALVNADYSRQIIFRVAGPRGAESTDLDPDAYSVRVLMQNPGAAITRVFSAVADSRRGPAYEVNCSGPSNTLRRAIFAYIPGQCVVLEFALVSSPEQFETARHSFNTVMLTFRAADAGGELHVSPISDKL
jgi:hypothetical protein